MTSGDLARTSPPLATDRATPTRNWPHLLAIYGMRVALVLVILLAWQLVGGSSSKLFFFTSKPTAVWDSLTTMVPTGDFWSNVGITLWETVIGFLIGGAAGILAGFGLAFSRTVTQVVEPIMNALNSLPRIALASLFILWFGLGTESKIALVISLVFFPLFLNAYSGATTIDPDLALLMRSLRATRLELVRKVTIPSTVPWIVAGSKLGVAQALGGAVVGEIIAAQRGLGAALNAANGSFDAAGQFAILLVLVIIALVLNGVFSQLETWSARWR